MSFSSTLRWWRGRRTPRCADAGNQAILAARSRRTEGHRLVLPGHIEGGEIGRLGIRFVEKAGESLGVRLCAGERRQRRKGRLVRRMALTQSFRESTENVRRLRQYFARLGYRQCRQIFEEQRQKIRKL